MAFVIYAVLMLLAIVMPSGIISSETTQLFMRSGAAVGGILGFLAGAGVDRYLPKAGCVSTAVRIVAAVLCVLIFMASVCGILSLVVAIDPGWTSVFPSWKPLREMLQKNPIIANAGAGIAFGALFFRSSRW